MLHLARGDIGSNKAAEEHHSRPGSLGWRLALARDVPGSFCYNDQRNSWNFRIRLRELSGDRGQINLNQGYGQGAVEPGSLDYHWRHLGPACLTGSSSAWLSAS